MLHPCDMLANPKPDSIPTPPTTVQTKAKTSNSKVLSEQISEERERVQRRVDGFNWKKSNVWKQLCCRFGPKLNQEELVSVADLLCEKLNIKLDRDARRRKSVIIKWFEEHWTQIHPILPMITLEP